MNTYSLSHVSDSALLRHAAAAAGSERGATATLLAHIAEIDLRKLYLPAGYPSMFLYCVHELHLCEQAAYKRILAARTARRFPVIFTVVAEGRLHLSAVVLLAPHLSEETVGELLVGATHKTKSEIEHLIAQRFPRPDLPSRVQLLPAAPSAPASDQLSPGIVEPSAPARIEAPVQRPKVAPLAPERFALQCTLGKRANDLLHRAQELLSHQVPSGDVATVLERALEQLVHHLEKTRFTVTDNPLPRSCRSSAKARHIPAHVKRAVWERDQGMCTFVSSTGQRCRSRKFLEFDHADPVARGGQATVERVRLRCRGHNQYEAERTFGAEFMRHKREAAQEAAAARRAKAAADAAEQAKERDVIPWLRRLGFRVDEARRAAALCEKIPDAPLEERVRVALSNFHPRKHSHSLRGAVNNLEMASRPA